MLPLRLILALLATLHLSGSAIAQQNLFNVPSSDITIKSKLFFQQQINFISNGELLFNTNLCWGMGRSFEVGVNILGVFAKPGEGLLTNPDKSNPPLYPYFTINMQKAWVISKTFKVALGTQTGFSSGQFGSYNYGNVVTALPGLHLKLITGVNFGTESFLGPGDLNPLLPSDYDPVGYQIGFEQEVISEKLTMIGEHISGSHTLGMTALGLGYHITEHWVLSLGYQLSNPNNQAPNSVVFEFTFVPSVISHRKIYHHGHLDED